MSFTQEHPAVVETLQRRKQFCNASQIKKWGFFNMCVLSVLLWDISLGILSAVFECFSHSILFLECLLAFLLFLNCVLYLRRYVNLFASTPVTVNDAQMKLLGINPTDPGFQKPEMAQKDHATAIGNIISPSAFSGQQSTCFSAGSGFNRDMSPSSPFMQYSSRGSSPSKSFGSPYLPFQENTQIEHANMSGSFGHSGSFIQNITFGHSRDNASDYLNPNAGSPSLSPLFRNSPNNSSSLRSRFNNSLNYSPKTSDDYIKDLKSYSQLLQEYDDREMKSQASVLDNTGSPQSFWNFNRTISDYSSMLRKYTYQIACRSPQSAKTAQDENDDGPSHYESDEVWQRADVSRRTLDFWIERLRKWLGLTIMKRLLNEIDVVNKKLVSIGCDDMEIGEVGVSVLKHLANSKAQHLPTLQSLVPFLDISDNQAYVVQRIKELGSTSCLADFRWQSGSEFKGKPWEEPLPTDAGLVAHVFCCYMDSRLPPHPRHPDGKTFTNQHFMRTPNTPSLSEKENLYIYQTKVNPPHFKVVIGNDIWNLPKGRNNLFQAMLLFLNHVNKNEKGMLGKVNLGMSGINILWVVSDTDK